MMDFSSAPAASEQFTNELIPAKTLAWAVVKLRPYNEPQGIAETPSSANPANAYLDLEFTIKGGKYDKRKVWKMLGVRGSESWVNQGRAAIRAMLEVGRQASQQNPQGYHLRDFFGLDGLTVAIEIDVEKGKGDYSDKNVPGVFLSPDATAGSSINAKFAALVRGDCYPAAAPAAGGQTPANPPQQAMNFQATTSPAPAGNQFQPATPQTSPSNPPTAGGFDPNAKPSWLESVPK